MTDYLDSCVGGAICAAIIIAVLSWHSPTRYDVTWYKAGAITASGEPFNAQGMTMAVKRYGDMGHFYKVSYRGKKVYVWANDILPAKAHADYDLAEGAFQRLADPKVGRIRAVVERLND